MCYGGAFISMPAALPSICLSNYLKDITPNIVVGCPEMVSFRPATESSNSTLHARHKHHSGEPFPNSSRREWTSIRMTKTKLRSGGRSRRHRPAKKLSEKIMVYLSLDEKRRIEEKEQELGVTLSQFMAERALEATAPTPRGSASFKTKRSR